MTEQDLIKLAYDSIDVVILRRLVEQAESCSTTIITHQLQRLVRVRELLAECDTVIDLH